MICTSRRCVTMAELTARPRGSGPWSSMARSTCAYNGQKSRWYQAALRQNTGRITAAGITKDVAFVPVDGAVLERIDDAYRAKYKSSDYLGAMIGASARAATVNVVPREGQE